MAERDIERVDADLRRVGEAADGLVRSAQELRAALDGLSESVRAAVRAVGERPSAPVEPAPEEEAPSAAKPDMDAARIVALNMALDGKPRDEVAAYLRDELGVTDSDALLDDVYARVG